ncbi:MAG: cell division protein FtsZ [Bacteroidales bacterium]
MSDIEFFDIIPAMEQQGSYIKVIGVGGAGTNAVNHMYNKGITGVDFIVCNTDKQSLEASPVATKIKLGDKDLGAGNDPLVGQQAAVTASDRIKSVLSNNTHMLFIAAGMGGGTGTGASPEIAKIAKEIEIDGGNDEILVVAVVTIPFSFEGRRRREQAKVGIENLKKVVDAIITVNTDKLKGKGTMLLSNAFALADDVLLTAAKGISEIMTANAYIHVDFRDVQSVMKHSGVALMGSGIGEGEDRAYKAIVSATTSDLLNDNDLKNTKNILLYVSFSSKEEYQLQMEELETITNYIDDQTSADVDKIWGYGYDDSLEEKIAITLVATGFENKEIYCEEHRNKAFSQDLKDEDTVEMRVLPVVDDKENTPSRANIETSQATMQTVSQSAYHVKQTELKNSVLPFVVREKTKSTTQTNIAIEEESQMIKIKLGEPLIDSQIVRQTVTPQPVEENKEDILKAFAITEKEIRQDNFAEKEQNDISGKDVMSSLFAKTENREMDQIFKSENVPSQYRPTLRDITLSESGFVGDSLKISNTPQDIEAKKRRIKRINEELKAGNTALIESLRPTIDDIDEKLSQVNNSDTRMGLSKDGTVILMENPVIGSGVD